MTAEEQARLLERSRGGDVAAFTALVEHFQGPLSRYLLHLVGDRDLAADLTQDTLIELYESLGRVEVRAVQAWLYRAATNNALSALRRRRRFRWLPFDWLRDQAAAAAPEGETVERQAVRAALLTLPSDQATCLLLHESAGLSCAEIATQQAISLDAAKQRLARGRRAFIAAYTAQSPQVGRPAPAIGEEGSPQ
jgi:RNA polymerase sigma-70 factor (ECF subfamily)